MFKEFKEFAFKGDVVDLAIGIIIGAAFGAIIKSLVDNIINPLVGAIVGGRAALYGLAVSIGSVRFTYGAFLGAVLNFAIVAALLFLLVKAVNRFRTAEEATDRACPHCLTLVPKAASRCSACTSVLNPE